ncbi:uncharacterized protein CDAR_584081 [Caerostris darwini]|uniref:Uncharacterized protein n=1 Tax=Caerostris darwini TaxID=1538125 RepID=A0AAV4WB60_9ARAC|nr:uncharacterized protein CDAR_584081 [Caerostris darwini]
MRTVVPAVLPLRVHGLKRPQASKHTPAAGPPAAVVSPVVPRVTSADRNGALPRSHRNVAAQATADHRPHVVGTLRGSLRRAPGLFHGSPAR